MPGELSLRLAQFSIGPSSVVEISVEEPGRAREAVRVPLAWQLSAGDRESLRWYFEEYLQFPADPAPSIAAKIEARIAELGKQLFASVFAGDDARDLWSRVRTRLHTAHVEVLSELDAPTELPWELLWDPRTDVPVAVRAASFTRGYINPAQPPQLPAAGVRPVRILLAICRPSDQDVPFRSVASRLIKGIGERHRDDVRLDVLRPPTFERLAEVLRTAAQDTPYHIVHFDGHGTFAVGANGAGRGHLVFEDDSSDSGVTLVDGSRIGGLLAETNVPYLILNACRSGRREPMMQPGVDDADAHARVRAYGSLALEAMDAGVAGVVAMQYNVYVVTAARFVGDMYATLARGHTLGRAVSLGRKQLHAQPRRDLVGLELDFADWPVPIVYEAAGVSLFPADRPADGVVEIKLDETGASPTRGTVDPELPAPPDAGFYGRDETLLAIDRAFDNDRIVLLHAYAGSGKTSTAAEFARWYTLTGGNGGPILFTSFERYTPLARVLDDFAAIFAPALEAASVAWLTLDDQQRREVAIQILSQAPALWVWDNVEQVAGFPSGTRSAWTDAEQQELVSFLRELRATKGRVLLTSRRDEDGWLGGLPIRVTLPGMPFQERVQLARALAQRLGTPIRHLDAWRPLLRYTQGNPLTITVVVGEAVRQRFSSAEQIERFVADLKQGIAEVADDQGQGRSASLGASLSYGFREAFDERDLARLALLHLFDSEVADFLLAQLGEVGDPPLASVAGLQPNDARRLLDRAAEIGHLTARGNGGYTIHPALPAYFKALFVRHYPGEEAISATRAFCEVIGAFGTYITQRHQRDGHTWVLSAFEPNLLRARRLAREHGWRQYELSAMRALHDLHEHEGRWTAWSRLLAETLEGIVDPATDGPLPDLEQEWLQVTQWRVRLAFARDDTAEAGRLQRLLVAHVIADAEAAAEQGRSDAAAQRAFTSAAIALSELGAAQMARQDPQALDTLDRARRFAELGGRQDTIATIEYNLAVALLTVTQTPALEDSQRLLQHALELYGDTDPLSRSRCYAELGFIAISQANAATDRAIKQERLAAAIDAYERGLALTPPNATESLAHKHMNLGSVYLMAGSTGQARPHLDAAIRLAERSGQIRVAGRARAQIARQLLAAQQREESELYAKRAISDLESVDPPDTRLIGELNVMLAHLGRGERRP